MKNFANNLIAGCALFSVAVMATPQASAQDATGQRVKQLEERLQAIQSEL